MKCIRLCKRIRVLNRFQNALAVLTWIGWWIMCWTVGCPVAELGPAAGLSTVVPLELDITAAAAAPVITKQNQLVHQHKFVWYEMHISVNSPLGKWEVKGCGGAAEDPICSAGAPLRMICTFVIRWCRLPVWPLLWPKQIQTKLKVTESPTHGEIWHLNWVLSSIFFRIHQIYRIFFITMFFEECALI